MLFAKNFNYDALERIGRSRSLIAIYVRLSRSVTNDCELFGETPSQKLLQMALSRRQQKQNYDWLMTDFEQ